MNKKLVEYLNAKAIPNAVAVQCVLEREFKQSGDNDVVSDCEYRMFEPRFVFTNEFTCFRFTKI